MACIGIDQVSEGKKPKNQRIEYIDALRGFTMLLVVCSHVSTFVIASKGFTFSAIFQEFRMPLFFFVSGFVFFKIDRLWNMQNSFSFLKKKLTVQIVFPLLCMLLYVCCFHPELPIIAALGGEHKMGYWFTFALFEFFCIYITLDTLLQHLFIGGIKDLILLAIGISLYIMIYVFNTKSMIHQGCLSLFGVSMWHHFLFFVIGTLTKKYFRLVQNIIDNRYAITLLLMLFIALNFFESIERMSTVAYCFTLSLSGILIVFSFFRRYQSNFSKSQTLGRAMQYVGRRTLDVYLLHYFFIMGISKKLFANINISDSPFVEFLISVVISILVIGMCLIVSNILRLSPIIEQYCFGVKSQKH